MTTIPGLEWQYDSNNNDRYWWIGEWEPFVHGPRADGIVLAIGKRHDWNYYNIYISPAQCGDWRTIGKESDLDAAQERALTVYLQALLGEA